MGSPVSTETITNTEKTITNTEIVEALSSMDKATIRAYRQATPDPDLSHLPGDKGMPVFGHMYWFVKDIRSWLDKEYEQYGPVFRFRLPMMGDSLFLLGPEANRLLLLNENKLFSNYLSWGPALKGVFDNAVLARDFNYHKKTRKTLQAAFKRQAVEGHMELMNPLLRAGIEKWPNNSPIKALDHVKKLLLDTAAKVFLGLDMGPEAERINQAFIDILGSTNDPFRNEKIPFSPHAKACRGRKLLESFVMQNIPERRKVEGRDIFSQLCHLRDEEGELLSEKEITDQTLFLLFAAHDTTTSALCGVLHSLATHQQWQEQLRQEMNSLDKEVMEFEDYDRMPKTTMVIQEVLRLYPPITLFPRYALEAFEFEGHKIPKGTRLWLTPTFTHRMPEYWSNPEQFDPERFSPERAEDKKDFYQYVPFGGGAHKCLGLHFAQIQSKMFLFHLLKNHSVTMNPRVESYKHNNIPMALPRDGLPITLSKL